MENYELVEEVYLLTHCFPHFLSTIYDLIIERVLHKSWYALVCGIDTGTQSAS